MNEELRPYFQVYGCDINPDGFIVTKGQKATSIHVTVKKGRMRLSTAEKPLFSGAPTAKSVANFLESYWYLKPLTEKEKASMAEWGIA